MILNDACDAAWDRDHRPERPIPSGRIALPVAWGLGLAWLLGGAAIMILLGGASWLMTLLLLAAIVAYDVYHKPWAGSVIVMGACRTLLYLAAGSAFGSDVLAPHLRHDATALLVQVGPEGVLLGLYIIGLTLLARSEAKGNSGPIVRRLLILLLLTPAFGSIFCHLGTPLEQRLSLFILPLFVGLVIYAVVTMRKGGPQIGTAVGWLLAGVPLVDALAVANYSLRMAIFFAILPPWLRLWQRWVAAT
jgi:4-hydroxybenzoate polyprenyltransferase